MISNFRLLPGTMIRHLGLEFLPLNKSCSLQIGSCFVLILGKEGYSGCTGGRRSLRKFDKRQMARRLPRDAAIVCVLYLRRKTPLCCPQPFFLNSGKSDGRPRLENMVILLSSFTIERAPPMSKKRKREGYQSRPDIESRAYDFHKIAVQGYVDAGC